MRTRRDFQSFPDARRRAGPKVRRRKARKKEKARHGQSLRYGIRLQEAVHRHLARLGITHRVIGNDEPLARAARVELVVETGVSDPTHVEFQYTLRRQTRPKILQFVRAAIGRKSTAVPRVYLEIKGPDMSVNELADRVAHAIRRIVDSIDSFAREPGNVIGLLLRVNEDKRALPPESISLFGSVGTKARAALVACKKQAELREFNRRFALRIPLRRHPPSRRIRMRTPVGPLGLARHDGTEPQ